MYFPKSKVQYYVHKEQTFYFFLESVDMLLKFGQYGIWGFRSRV